MPYLYNHPLTGLRGVVEVYQQSYKPYYKKSHEPPSGVLDCWEITSPWQSFLQAASKSLAVMVL